MDRESICEFKDPLQLTLPLQVLHMLCSSAPWFSKLSHTPLQCPLPKCTFFKGSHSIPSIFLLASPCVLSSKAPSNSNQSNSMIPAHSSSTESTPAVHHTWTLSTVFDSGRTAPSSPNYQNHFLPVQMGPSRCFWMIVFHSLSYTSSILTGDEQQGI